MKLSRVVIIVVAAVLLGLSGCDRQAKQAMEPVDQFLKPMGPKETKMSLFVPDPASADRAYLSVAVTWNFANPSGQPQKENLGFIMKKSGEKWEIEKPGVKYTDDKSNALTLLKGGKF
ncbi:MAG TPA: hypothetical protein VKJ45_15730 [Blastocatellia bacterium]|nr:hypothetical protein [Blastocatellia bacterium]